MGGVELLGVAADLDSALAFERRPDVVLVDLSLPRVCRRDVIHLVAARWPAARILAMTVYPTGPDLVLSIGEGAHGYVVKDIAANELCDAIHALASGSTYYATVPITYHTADALCLTPVERAVLRQIAEGATDAQAANALHRARRTIEHDLGAIRAKAGLAREPASRALLTRFAMEHDPYCKLTNEQHRNP